MAELTRSKTVAVTGGCGFAGRYLVAQLIAEGSRVIILDKAISLPTELMPWADSIELHRLDLTAPTGLAQLFETLMPDEIYHLAGIANVKHSWEGEGLTYKVNLIGTVNLLSALKSVGAQTDVLIVGSGEVYGLVPQNEQPITEDRHPDPRSPYAASKLCQEIAAGQMANHLKGKCVFVRPFNHIGPGQHPSFVTSDFARQVARIERGEMEPIIRVGNLQTYRDFMDVRDTIEAYILALRCGENRMVLNVCSGKPIRIDHILDFYKARSRKSIDVQVDPDRFRPADIPMLCGSYERLQKMTGWVPRRSIEQALEDILEHWRQRPGE